MPLLQGPDRPDHCVLHLRDLRVRPTAMCIGLLLPCLPLLWLALRHQSWLAGLGAGSLISLTLGCWWWCVSSLCGLRLRATPPGPCFAGDMAMLELRIDNPSRRDRWDIGIGRAHGPDGAVVPVGPSGWIDVPPRSSNLALVPVPTRRRGPLRVPALVVETQHPLGLFQASAWWQPQVEVLVYPRPDLGSEGPAPWARKGHSTGEVWLDAAAAGPGDVERRLSRMTSWVLQAERRECDYGLRLGPTVVPPSRGLAQRRRCLELLARWSGGPLSDGPDTEVPAPSGRASNVIPLRAGAG